MATVRFHARNKRQSFAAKTAHDNDPKEDGRRMVPQTYSRADLHCHSTASQLSKLGVQRALGLPECATPPEEVYELAKRRGMDFVTITDHDTISGCTELADLPDFFVSEELTAWFPGEQQAVHVLCWGITPDDHDWLQRNNRNVDACAKYLHDNEIACALAHPFYAVEAPLTPRHRSRLAQLFPTWETRNGSRAPELNMPAAVYIETRGGTGVAGSDDHAGVDIGRTFTETPPAQTPEELLAHIRAGDAEARGEMGSAAKWSHAAMGLAQRAIGRGAGNARPNPAVVLEMIERVVREGQLRNTSVGSDLTSADAQTLLRTWLDSVDLGEADLLAMLQHPDFNHGELFRRARCAHERMLLEAVGDLVLAAHGGADKVGAINALFEACLPAIPYVPSVAFLAKEKAKLVARDDGDKRVALVADAIGSMHGVTRVLQEIRTRGVRGFEVEVIGTDPAVDRRLAAVAEIEMPFYAGLQIGLPTIPSLVETLAEGRYDVVHVCSPGPAGLGAALLARVMGIPVVGSYHTELASYAGLRSGDPALEAGMRYALGRFYGGCDIVLSPSGATDDSLRSVGVDGGRILRWGRGVDIEHFSPDKRERGRFEGEINVMYSGRLTKEKGVDLLAEAFLRAYERDRRLHLVLAGGGPEEDALRERLGNRATFLGWLDGEEYARAYASADLFLFASTTDTFGQVLLEAQASGLPVVAVAAGGPLELVENGVTGRLCPPDAEALADGLIELATRPGLRAALSLQARLTAAERSWESSLAQLATAYARTLAPQAEEARVAA
jgi:glycosyltransferase involved in cell wall biosynthesis/predicted metal-dependent phosphoesterase TrpH